VKKNQRSSKYKKQKNGNEENIELKPAKKGFKWQYSLLSVLLLIFLCQMFFGIIVNSVKAYSLRLKIAKLEKLNPIAENKNRYLREELEKYTSTSGVEALARNRLHFSKEDETLIIIKNSEEQDYGE